jgi:hypothetical protein
VQGLSQRADLADADEGGAGQCGLLSRGVHGISLGRVWVSGCMLDCQNRAMHKAIKNQSLTNT